MVAGIFFTAIFKFGPKVESTDFFFRGVIYCAASGVLSAVLVAIAKNYVNILTYQDVALALISSFSLLLVFFTHIPVTADRSLTIYMLGKMSADENKSYKKEELQHFLINQYIIEYDATAKRVEEQLKAVTIEGAGDGYRLTVRGQGLMALYKKIAYIFKIDDKLTNPRNKGQNEI